METPTVSSVGSTYVFEWIDAAVSARVQRIRDYDSYAKAEVTWQSSSPGYSGHIHQSVLSFSSTSSKQGLVRALESRHPEKDWEVIVEQLSVITLEKHRKGEPAVLLRTTPESIDPIEMCVSPLFYEEQPFILYGEPGTAKSYLAMLLLVAGAKAMHIPGTPFEAHRQHSCLYLDWESTERDQQKRLSRIGKGLGLDLDGVLHYRYCSAPLASDIDQVQSVIMETGAELVIIDSLGPASGGDLNSPQSAQGFFSALRTLKCTSVILAHTSKSSMEKRKTVFGSQFFTALARGTAEVKRFQEAGEDEISVGVFHRKSNISRLERPFGLRLLFDEDDESVRVEHQDIRDVPQVEAALPSSQRVLHALTSGSHAYTPAELAGKLDIPAGTIRSTLKRLCAKDQVVRLHDGAYAAATREEYSYEESPF